MSKSTRKSRYHNVYWYGRTRRWIAKIHARTNRSGKETINLGYYENEETAARVADVAELLIRGPDARLNFDGKPPASVPRAAVVETLLRAGAIDPEDPTWGVRGVKKDSTY